MRSHSLDIAHTWDGTPLAPEEHARVTLLVDTDGMTITVLAPFGDDPAPKHAAGRTDRLWDYEVVELFLAESAARGSRYLEVELGPHGHWLALGFSCYRERLIEPVSIAFEASIEGDRWRGEARLPGGELGKAIRHVGALNAYSIRGVAPYRRFFACAATPAGVYAGPDFHRLEHFLIAADDRDAPLPVAIA